MDRSNHLYRKYKWLYMTLKDKISLQIAPVEVTPVQVAPVQVAPVQVAPVQVATVQVATVQVAPVQVAPALVSPTYLIHKHLIISGKCKNQLRDIQATEQWMSRLISEIGMNILIAPQAVYQDDDDNRGITCIAILTTSHCSLHTFEQDNEVMYNLCLYSCKQFDTKLVFNLIDELLNVVTFEHLVLERNGSLKIVT